MQTEPLQWVHLCHIPRCTESQNEPLDCIVVEKVVGNQLAAVCNESETYFLLLLFRRSATFTRLKDSE